MSPVAKTADPADPARQPDAAGPLIGLSTYQETAAWGAWHAPASLLPQSYIDAVKDAGGVPLMLPAVGGKAAAAKVITMLDGLILTGGPDVDPAASMRRAVGSRFATAPTTRSRIALRSPT